MPPLPRRPPRCPPALRRCHPSPPLAPRQRHLHSARRDGPWTASLGFTAALQRRTPEIVSALRSDGWYTCTGLLGGEACATMRSEAEEMYTTGAFIQSMSTDEQGQAFPKEGVHALELDGNEW